MKVPNFCPGPQSRRNFMKLGLSGLGSLMLGNLDSVRANTKSAGKAFPDTQVIFIWLPGGPPHMETYDMKPDAPIEYRGDFKPIHTTVPGMDVCELLPLHAKALTSSALSARLPIPSQTMAEGTKSSLPAATQCHQLALSTIIPW